jgi:photosystem II stability/assembly factor-like uncharacterized protein
LILVGTATGLHRVEGGSDLAGREITALAGDWALVDGRAVWHGEVAGEVPEGCLASCLLPVGDDAAMVGTDDGHLWRISASGAELVDGFETAPGREAWYTPWGGPAGVRSLAAGSDGTLYVNVHVGGILRSGDGGASWAPTLDQELDVHQVIVAPDGTVLAATARGLATSTDGGTTWVVAADGLHATYSRAVALAGDTVLVTVSTGPDGRRAGVYRRPLHGDGPFERALVGLPGSFPGNVDTGCLAAGPDLAVLGTFAGRVYASTDAGATWRTIAAGPPVTCVSLA